MTGNVILDLGLITLGVVVALLLGREVRNAWRGRRAAAAARRCQLAHVVIYDETHVMDNAAMSRLADAIAGRLPQRIPGASLRPEVEELMELVALPAPVELRRATEDVITAAIRVTREAAHTEGDR